MSSDYLLTVDEQDRAIKILAKRRRSHGCLYEDLAAMIRQVWTPLTGCELRRALNKEGSEEFFARYEMRRQIARATLFSQLGM